MLYQSDVEKRKRKKKQSNVYFNNLCYLFSWTHKTASYQILKLYIILLIKHMNCIVTKTKK